MTARILPSTKDAIRRALHHHELTGTLYIASEQPVGSGKNAWRIRFTELDDVLFMSWREAYILTIALAHMERLARRMAT